MGEDVLIFLGLLILAVVIGLPILVIVALVKIGDANRRIAALEAQVIALAQREPLQNSTAEHSLPQAPVQPFSWASSHIPRIGQPAREGPPPEDRKSDPELPERIAADATLSASVESVAEPPSETTAPPPVFAQPPAIRVLAWVTRNWVYVISAASLALAGVFFVQYGIEAGLLPPPLRVLAGFVFGGGLIAGGEWLRRRYGSDEVAASTVYLPSVFSGAGLVAIFAAITAGRLMYGLYGPSLAFAGLFATALGAVWLGWRNGPFLVAVGLIGGAVAPFLVDGGGLAQPWLYGYYLILLAVGLAVDAWRHWGWVSVLSMVLAQIGLLAMREGGAGVEPWLIAQGLFVILAIALPARSLTPRHEGLPFVPALWLKARPLPGMPVRLAFGAVLAVSAQILLVATQGPVAGVMPYLTLTLLALLLFWWTEEAPALSDLAVIPAAAFLLRLALDQPFLWLWLQNDPALLPPETSAPAWASWLLLMAAAMSAAAAFRALRGGGLLHSLAAVVIGPLAAVALEALWTPGLVMGAYLWALHVIALAAGMVWLAAAFAKRDGGPGRRFAWATLSALSLIALSLFIVTTTAALTLALGVLLVVAVALDRRFDLTEMGWFVQAGAALIAYRLVVDPGLGWAETAALPALWLAHGGAAIAAAAAWYLIRPLKDRGLPRAVLESLGLVSMALLVNVLLLRALSGEPRSDGSWTPDYLASHWGAALNALPWLLLLGSQLWRGAAAEGWGRRLRHALAALSGVLAAAGLLLATTVFNPLWWGSEESARVIGPPLFDSLALAYALPGMLLLAILRFPPLLPAWARRMIAGLGGALLTLYAVTEIRRLWQGPDIGGPGVLQGELYSYTLALLVTGAVLLWQALARRSAILRRVAMAVIALTAAKVFLWDVSGLSGLVRVLSFAGLGLALAGLAWLNRWAGQAMESRDSD